MSDETQILTMKDALAATQAELVQVSTDETSPGVPPVNVEASAGAEEVPDSGVEQLAADTDSPTQGDSELSNLLDATVEETQNGSESGIEPGSDEFWNLGLEIQTVNGPETVTVQEMSDGYLRQADYTRKTQDLAAQRKQAEQALEFFSAFQSDPEGFARSIGVQAGFLDASSMPTTPLPMATIPTQEDIDVQVNAQLEERLASDPRIQTAEIAAAKAEIDTEFTRLESAYSTSLSPQVRESLLQEAIKGGSADLEGVLTRRIVQAQRKQSGSNSTPMSTARPGAAPQGATTPDTDKTAEKPSMRQAWQEAKVAATQ